MGYACPVCETPQSDAEHLANHLAFTAMLGDDDHEAWLDDHAPDWNEEGEDELAERIEEHAKEVGFPQVFDDTTQSHDHGDEPRGGELFEDELERANAHGRGSMASGTEPDAGASGSDAGSAGAGSSGALDTEAREILQEAREMTQEMVADESEEGNKEPTDERDE